MRTILLLCLFVFQQCVSNPDRQLKADKDKLYKDCMATFSDEQKCKSFVSNQAKEFVKEDPVEVVPLDPEVEKNIKNRDDLKDTLQNRNEPFVISYIGKPDKRFRDSSGRTHLIYYRPIARYSRKHDPDIEIDVILRRSKVSRVNHTPPPTTPTGFDLFTNKFGQKKAE
ncbi:MAG: hypothetical protein AAF518_02685 [Spirochaetota bacterium]